MASKPSIRPPAASSSTWLGGRGPEGRGFVERTSCARSGPGPGLMVNRADLEPARRADGFGLGGAGGVRAGRVLAGLWDRRAPSLPRAVRAFPDPRLEELTPELPDPAHRVREGPQRHHLRRARRGLDDRRVLGLGHAFRVDPDDSVVDAAFEDHQGAHPRVAFQAPGVRDLEPARGDDVAAHEAGDRDPRALDVSLDVGLWADEEVAVTLDLAAEAAKDLPAALALQTAPLHVFPPAPAC